MRALTICHPWLREQPHASGPWRHVYANPRAFPAPIPWKGAQGLWTFPQTAAPEGFAP